jgi:glycosyltransferase involved in cell wall biosynthesis
LPKKKIIFVIPTIKHGGAELFLLRLCALVQFEFEVFLVVIGKREGLHTDFEKLQITVHYLGFQNVIFFPFAFFRLRKIIRQESPSIVQSFLYSADILSSLALLNLGVPLKIWSLRGTELASNTKRYKIGIQKIAAGISTRFPDVIISCSDQVTEFHARLGYPLKKIITIGNFVSKWTQNLESRSVFLQDAHPKRFTVGLAARYDLGKGHQALINTVVEFLRRNPDLKMTVCFAGKGCDTDGRLSIDIKQNHDLRELLIQKRLKIVTSGLLTGKDLADWYQNLDLYFMASDSVEGFPNSLAEAVAIGLPSLATPVGAAMDFLSIDRIANSPSVKDMTDLLQHFYDLSLIDKRDVTMHLKNQILNKYDEKKILSKYTSVWAR